MSLTEKKVIAELRRQGYKLTPQRRGVIRTITSSRGHLTPAAIYEKACLEHNGIGLVTVYRTLDILTRLGEAFSYEDLETQRLPFEGLMVSVVTPRTLYRMKKDTVRPKDRMDADALRRKFDVEGS